MLKSLVNRMRSFEKQFHLFVYTLLRTVQNIFPARKFLGSQCLWSPRATPAIGTFRNTVSKGIDNGELIVFLF